MRHTEIPTPKGYEIDFVKSSIIFKPIEPHFPENVIDIEDRQRLNHDAFKALMELVELRDYVNVGWKPDWTDDKEKHCIIVCDNKIELDYFCSYQTVLHFEKREISDKFAVKYADLIERAKELL